MYTQYYTYKSTDYLTDDYFVDSMLHPTPESETFWKILIDDQKINPDEFISAYMLLKSLHENKPEVPQASLEMLWKRITETIRKREKRKKRFLLVRYSAVACCLVGLIGFALFSVWKNQAGIKSPSIADYARENIIHTKQPSNQIQLVTGNRLMAVEGIQAKVEYDATGKLKVNKMPVVTASPTNLVKELQVFSQLRVPYGKRAFLKLSDGTSLWVNTGSTVIYPTTFAKNGKREIFVEGEVFAEVFHDINRPFIIKTAKLDVQVLGTVFNVSAYKEDKQTNVVLVSGSVNVKPRSGIATTMKPNQLFAYTDEATTLRSVDVENYTSWHNGNYTFHNEPIETILLRLSRYYNVTMKLPSNPSGISCSGKLKLKDDLTQLLNGLSEITPLSFSVKDNEYRIKFD